MSRIGKKIVAIPSGVTVGSAQGKISVQGPKGKLEFPLYDGLSLKVVGSNVTVETQSNPNRQTRANHGLTRASLVNMIQGVTKGFEKKLEIVGVGWNAKVQGQELSLQVGYCHPAVFKIETGLQVSCPQPTQIVIQGVDKQKVGQFAAQVRASRLPEPYNGKGVKYEKEVIQRKAGKAFAAASS